MENTQQQILSEIKTLMASVRSQLEELDIKIAQWQQMVEPEEMSGIDLELDESVDFSFAPIVQELSDEDATPIVTVPVEADSATDEDVPVEDVPVEDIPVEDVPVEDIPVEDVPVEDIPVEDVPVEDVPEEDVSEDSSVEDVVECAHVEVETVEEVAVVEESVESETAEDVPAEDLPVEDVVEEDEDDLPFFDVPQDVPAAPSPKPAVAVEQPAVIDLMTEKYTWRTAIPGTPVKDIRGAIALNDRVLFINHLFGTDPMAFQDTLNQINQMQTFDEAVNYLAASHPEWDFNSNIVYSFMMAVRRKVN